MTEKIYGLNTKYLRDTINKMLDERTTKDAFIVPQNRELLILDILILLEQVQISVLKQLGAK